MKSFIRKHVLEAIRSLSLPAIEIDIEDVKAIRKRLIAKFSKEDADSLHWNALKDYGSIQHPDSWRWPEEFFGKKAIILLFDELDEPSAFRLEDGSQIARLLEECPGFEFYLTDGDLESMVCHNDHDYLIAAGNAKPWLESLEPRHHEWVSSLGGKNENGNEGHRRGPPRGPRP